MSPHLFITVSVETSRDASITYHHSPGLQSEGADVVGAEGFVDVGAGGFVVVWGTQHFEPLSHPQPELQVGGVEGGGWWGIQQPSPECHDQLLGQLEPLGGLGELG